MRSLNTFAWRNLAQHRLRTALSAPAVALGAATVVAADVISGALLNSPSTSENAQKFMTGLLEQLEVTLQMVGLGITLAAGFLIFNAFVMAVTQRRRVGLIAAPFICAAAAWLPVRLPLRGSAIETMEPVQV